MKVTDLWELNERILKYFPLPEGFQGNISILPTKEEYAEQSNFVDSWENKKYVTISVWYSDKDGSPKPFFFHCDEDEILDDAMFERLQESLRNYVNQESLVGINDLLNQVFETLEQLEWMDTANPMLNGETPGEWIMQGKAVSLLERIKQDKAFQ